MRSLGRRIRPGVGLLRGMVQTIWIARAPLTAAAITAPAITAPAIAAPAITAAAIPAGCAARRPPNSNQTIVDGPSQNNDAVTALSRAASLRPAWRSQRRGCGMRLLMPSDVLQNRQRSRCQRRSKPGVGCRAS